MFRPFLWQRTMFFYSPPKNKAQKHFESRLSVQRAETTYIRSQVDSNRLGHSRPELASDGHERQSDGSSHVVNESNRGNDMLVDVQK